MKIIHRVGQHFPWVTYVTSAKCLPISQLKCIFLTIIIVSMKFATVNIWIALISLPISSDFNYTITVFENCMNFSRSTELISIEIDRLLWSIPLPITGITDQGNCTSPWGKYKQWKMQIGQWNVENRFPKNLIFFSNFEEPININHFSGNLEESTRSWTLRGMEHVTRGFWCHWPHPAL